MAGAQSGGLKELTIYPVSGGTTVAASHHNGLLNVTASAAIITITLPSAATLPSGFQVQIRRDTASSYNVAVAGGATATLTASDTQRSYLCDGAQWIAQAAGGGAAAWGGITGTLSAQTDLASALSAKAADSAVVHLAGTETITGAKSHSALQTFTAGLSVTAGTTAVQGLTCATLAASDYIISEATANAVHEMRARNLSTGAAAFSQIVAQNDGTRRTYLGAVGTAASGLGGANTSYVGSNGTLYFLANDAVVGNWSSAGLAATGDITTGQRIGAGGGGLSTLAAIYVGGMAGVTATNAIGLFINATYPATATASCRGAHFSITTPAGVTTAEATAFVLPSIGKGSGGTITRCQGTVIFPNSNGVNNAAILIDTGYTYTGNWAIYSASSYNSCLAGSLAVGSTALLASERLRVAGGTMGTPGATDVLLAAGKLSCGDTSATSIHAAGGITAAGAFAAGNSAAAGITCSLDALGANAAFLRFKSAGVTRWDTGRNGSAEYTIAAYDAAGSYLDSPITIPSATSGAMAVSRSINVSTGKVYSVAGTQVVGARGAAVADATDAATAITQLNALLARCRAHGLIA